jgi:hypothetical protein
MPTVTIISEKKYRVNKSRSLKHRDARVHHLTEFGLRIQGKKIVPAKEYKILKIK